MPRRPSGDPDGNGRADRVRCPALRPGSQSSSTLVPMTSLIIARYESPCCDHCAWQEHAAIIDAVEQGDAEAALGLMHKHLDRLEEKLDLK